MHKLVIYSPVGLAKMTKHKYMQRFDYSLCECLLYASNDSCFFDITTCDFYSLLQYSNNPK